MKIQMILLLVNSIATAAISSSSSSSIAEAKCPDRCGDVMVPYPFGIGSPNCAKNESFLLTCNETTQILYFALNIPVYSISFENATLTGGIRFSYECYYNNGSRSIFNNRKINLPNWKVYTISPTRNRFVALGCDTKAMMYDDEERFGSGCTSMCNNKADIQIDTSCSGLGCCQTAIPKYLKNLHVIAGSVYNHTNVMDFNPCSYAFVAENSFNISEINYLGLPTGNPRTPVVFEWAIGSQSCGDEEHSCGANADCSSSDTGAGYRCLCKLGFRGNPYLPQGCQDIDECKEPNKYHCQGKCKNSVGNYTCHCPLGMRGDGKVGCNGISLINISTVIGGIILAVTITFLSCILFQRRKKEKYFKENGGLVLKHQRIRIFSEAELVKATNNYDTSRFLGEGGFGSVYRGVLDENTQVAVKKAKGVDRVGTNQEYQHEMTIVSQVNHRNVVKVLGLCLETKIPLLVYEFISNGTLYDHIHDKGSQVLKSWNVRLRIATETALALDYLHSLADPPIIHGDVKSMNILLDEYYTAKVADFGASKLISPNQTGIGSKIQGTFGYLDPEYLMTGNLTTKSDVYSFGVVMVELLTGEKPTSRARAEEEKRNIIQYFISFVEEDRIIQILNFDPVDDGEMEEVEVVAHLVRRCLNGSGLKRPTMKEVVEELVRLKKLNENCWTQKKTGEETECLLADLSSHPPSYEFSNTIMDSYSVQSTFDMEQASSSISSVC